MTQIIVDAALRGKLNGLTEPLELCDEAGKVLAHVTPVPDELQYEAAEPPLSADELERRRQEPDYSTAEVLNYLESL